jgi:hypothetical protein
MGAVPELDGIIAAVHAAGARISLDAVAATPHRRMDLAALGADTLTCSAYKWYGPHVGILCGAPGVLEEAAARQAPSLAGRGAGPLGAGHAPVRVARRRARRGRVHARRRLRRDPRARGGPDGDRRRRPRGDRRRDGLRRPARPGADADVNIDGLTSIDAARALAQREVRSGTATTTRTSSSASSASTRTARCAPGSSTTTTGDARRSLPVCGDRGERCRRRSGAAPGRRPSAGLTRRPLHHHDGAEHQRAAEHCNATEGLAERRGGEAPR